MSQLLFKKLREDINKEMHLSFDKCETALGLDMMLYQTGLNSGSNEDAQGKRFRPMLCLLTALALKVDHKKVLPAAAAIELIHNFSLIHDDIQDEDEFRRGRMTLWKKRGISQAINAGDAMHSLSNIALNRLFEKGFSGDVINSVSFAINYSCFQMCEGQVLDVEFEKIPSVSFEKYLEMITKKTAFLIQAGPLSAALIGTHDKNIIERFSNFGMNLGIAFQIFNDVSGFKGNPKDKFNHFASDLKKNKKSLPVILALKNKKILAKKHNAVKLFKLIEESGAVFQARKIGDEYFGQALFELEKTKIKNSYSRLLLQYISKVREV